MCVNAAPDKGAGDEVKKDVKKQISKKLNTSAFEPKGKPTPGDCTKFFIFNSFVLDGILIFEFAKR
jgi:hypothetical protein